MLLTPPHLGAAALCASQLIAAYDDGAAAQQKPIPGHHSSGSFGGQGEKGKENPLTEQFDQRIENLLEEWHVPGLAIGIVDGNETWTKVFTFPVGFHTRPQGCFSAMSRSMRPSLRTRAA